MRILLLCCLMSVHFINAFADDKLFAVLKNDSVEIVYDTLTFKEDVLKIAFDNYNPKPSFSSVSVISDTVIGDSSKVYYAIILQDTSGTIKVAKWLERRGNRLFMTDHFNNKNHLQAYYFTCIGEEGCRPMVLSVEGKLGWSCSPVPVCVKGEDCRAEKSVVID